MRKFFTFVGVVATVLTIATCSGFAYLTYQSKAMDQESRDYAKASVVAITSNWSPAVLLTQATPALISATNAQSLRTLFAKFDTLGPLVKVKSCTGTTTVSYNLGQKLRITSLYACEAQYRNAPATVRISLEKIDQAWRVNAFYVASPGPAPSIVRKI
jgi:hypothetical protein